MNKWTNTYYENNKDTKVKEYLDRTKEHRLSYGKNYYENNKEERLNYYQKNREKRIEYQKKYRQECKIKKQKKEDFKKKMIDLLKLDKNLKGSDENDDNREKTI